MHRRHAGPTLRAFRGIVGLHVDLPERMERDVDPPFGTLHQDRGTDDRGARRANGVDGLLRRTARRHDVIDHKHSLALTEAKASAEFPALLALAALRIDRAAAKLARDLVGEDDAAGRGSGDGLDREVAGLVGDRRAEALGPARPLKHLELLQIPRRMSPRGQGKVTLEECSGVPEQGFDLPWIDRHQVETNAPRMPWAGTPQRTQAAPGRYALDVTAAVRPGTTRQDQLRVFGEDRLVGVIRTATVDLADRAARTLAEAGIRLIEITLTVPDAFELIRSLSQDATLAARGVIIGSGTVLTPRQAEDSCLAGARFLVSPIFFPEMITVAHAHDGMAMPGTLSPTEMVGAATAGADFVKIYPLATIGGPDFVTNVRRALPQLPLVATGNIELAEVPAYLKAGVVGFGNGAPLTRPDLLERGETAAVIAGARAFLSATRRV